MSASPGVSQDAGNEQEQNWKAVGKSKFSNPKRCFVYSTGHNEVMTTATALDQIFNSVGDCLSVEAAAKLRDLRISDELQSQLDTWARQNAEGALEAEGRQQYESILRALNFVAVLQAKARRIAEQSSGS